MIRIEGVWYMASIDEALAVIKRGMDELIPEEGLIEKLREGRPLRIRPDSILRPQIFTWAIRF